MTAWIPLASAIAEILLFPLAAAIAFRGLRRSALQPRQKMLLAGAMVFSVLAKIGLASVGHNWDLESYALVSNLVQHGLSVYANTDRYNYGPIWAWAVAGFGHLAGPGRGKGFTCGSPRSWPWWMC